MNIISKIYCRVFQKIFKLAIPLLPYRNPEIIDDIPALSRLAAKEANPIYPVPRLMNGKELEKLYEYVMEEE